MLPVVAIVGRPNVGKSTLFNRLTKSKAALVLDRPGTTRDRQFGEAEYLGRKFIIIDTGGLQDETNPLHAHITEQTLTAIEEADHVLFVLDGTEGITQQEVAMAKQLRRTQKPIVLAINKTEKTPAETIHEAGLSLGFARTLAISAKSGKGVKELIELLFPKSTPANKTAASTLAGIKIAIAGKPNIGKSTLINRMLGEERVIVHDSPGTTRDSIYIPLTRYDKHYTLIDTAGVRKRGKVRESELPEKFSVVKTLQSIENANVVLFVIDARLGVSEQDLKLIGFVLECGKALVIAINKWDGLSEEARDHAKATIDRHLDFVRFARIHFISALHGSGVGNLFDSVNEAYESATKKLSTPMLTRLLQKALVTHSPPLVHGRRVKLRYAHPGGHNPPLIVIHGNLLDALPDSYRRYLSNFFQTKLKLYGTPVNIQFKTSENPF